MWHPAPSLRANEANVEMECQARLFIANNHYKNSEFHLAQKAYKIVAEKSKLDHGAEAKYQLAYLSFLQEDFEESETAIFDLSDSYFNDYFIAKGFILLAGIYLHKENYFQSKATLNSILENYDGDDELKAMCQTKIETIERIERQKENETQNREIIIDLLDDVTLSELLKKKPFLKMKNKIILITTLHVDPIRSGSNKS